MRELKSQKGMAAIFTVLVIGAASLIMARSVAFLSMNSLDTAFISDKGREVEYLAEGCVEESMRRIQLNHDYLESGADLMIDGGVCHIVVSGDSGNKVLAVTGTVGDYNKKIITRVVINNDEINLSDWNSND